MDISRMRLFESPEPPCPDRTVESFVLLSWMALPYFLDPMDAFLAGYGSAIWTMSSFSKSS